MRNLNTRSFLNLIAWCLIFFLSAGVYAEEKVSELIGAGASFPYPLYSKWFEKYANEKGIKVNYQSIGSGGGIRQLMNKTVDFGATDAFLDDEEKKQFEGEVLHIPTALGGVAVVYNLPVSEHINLAPDVLSDIMLGVIASWNDPRIKALNPESQLANQKIVIVHRSDGSGTTFIFTDYLSKVSHQWKEKVGAGKSVNWPIGIGGKGNEGVAGMVKQMPGSIGYVEVIYAEKNNLRYAKIKNKAGAFVSPTLKSVSESANIALPDDLRVSLTNTDSPEGYPISGLTWLLVYKEQSIGKRSIEKSRAVKELLTWCITTGQQYNQALLYAPLPEAAVKKAMKLINSMTYDSKPL